MAIQDDVRALEAEVRRLEAENRDLENDNSMYRQRALDEEKRAERAEVEAKRANRDVAALSEILESQVVHLNQAMRRYRENLAQREMAGNDARPLFLSRIQDDVKRNGSNVDTPETNAAANESEASRMLRTTHAELPRPETPLQARPQLPDFPKRTVDTSMMQAD